MVYAILVVVTVFVMARDDLGLVMMVRRRFGWSHHSQEPGRSRYA